MNIITILGSPRRAGNTAAVLKLFDQQMTAAGHSVRRVNLIDLDLQGCLGCDNCQGVDDEPGCIQDDDIGAVIEQILAADLAVYASPVYAWSLTGQMKALFDRHYCLVKWSGEQGAPLLPGKPVMLLATCGGGVDENTDLLKEMFRRQMEYLQWEILGQFFVGGCTTPDALGEKAPAAARAMAQAVLAR